MALKQITRVNIAEKVFEQLRDQILQGTWKEGEKLPSEQELTETLGVSRSSVRQAIRTLADYGMVETRNGTGTYVKRQISGNYMLNIVPIGDLQFEDIVEVLDFLCLIEDSVAAMAVQRCTCLLYTSYLENIHLLPIELQQELSAYIVDSAADQRHFIIASATNRIHHLLSNDQFLYPLYQKISSLHVILAPLREFPDSITDFSQIFLTAANQEYQKSIRGFEEGVVALLEQQHWTVSYTHLDVYKRQLPATPDLPPPRPADRAAACGLRSWPVAAGTRRRPPNFPPTRLDLPPFHLRMSSHPGGYSPPLG